MNGWMDGWMNRGMTVSGDSGSSEEKQDLKEEAEKFGKRGALALISPNRVLNCGELSCRPAVTVITTIITVIILLFSTLVLQHQSSAGQLRLVPIETTLH